MASPPINNRIRYESDEKCTPLSSFIVGIQGIMIPALPIVVSIVVINVLAAGQDEAYLSWAVFSTLIIVGIVTALQASRISRLGAGHLVVVGVTPNYIPLSVLALDEGGPAMLASLMVASGLFFLAIATRLPQLRRVITPTVSGTVLMLITVMLLPICLDRFVEVPEGVPAFSGLCIAVVTLMISTALILRAPQRWRPWSMLIGFAFGCMVAALLGVYDLERLYTSPWVGIPQVDFQGLDLTPAAGFWALLPMFLIVTLVQAIKGIGDNVVIQRVSRRRPRTTDFRLLQGSLYSNGVGILLSGLAGTPPPTSYASYTASLVNMTGVAARNVGYAIAIILLGLALLPKFTGALLTIPSPVMGAFLLIAVGILFVEGVQTVVQDGLDFQKSLVVAVSFALGAGLEQQNILDLENLLVHPWGTLFGSGITVGAATAIALNVFLNVTSARSRKLEVRLDFSDLPRIDAFMQKVAADMDWSEVATQRLRSAGEETLSSLLQPDSEYPADSGTDKTPRLIIAVRPDRGTVEMEFVSTLEDEENLEDRLAHLNEEEESVDEREISFRLLRHYASSVRHRKYQGMDIVTVRVEA